MHSFPSITSPINTSCSLFSRSNSAANQDKSLKQAGGRVYKSQAQDNISSTTTSDFLVNFFKDTFEESSKKQRVSQEDEKKSELYSSSSSSVTDSRISSDFVDESQDEIFNFLTDFFNEDKKTCPSTSLSLSSSSDSGIDEKLPSQFNTSSVVFRPYSKLSYLSHNAVLAKINVDQSSSSQSAASSLEKGPIQKLSIGLINTYQEINKLYFSKKKASAEPSQATSSKQIQYQKYLDSNNIISSNLLGRVVVLDIGTINFEKMLGYGSFGEVYEGTYQPCAKNVWFKVALKVNHIHRKKEETRETFVSIERECFFLKKFRQLDPSDCLSITRYVNSCLLQKDRLCLIEPLYSMNLRDLISKTSSAGLSLRIICKMANQLFNSLDFLRCKEVNIVHFDLKPENILLESSQKAKIRIIDFGSSKHISELEDCEEYLVTRYYRPPELVLKLPYTHAVDTWSVGCILAEMLIGRPLFPAKDNWDLLLMINQLIGPLPYSIVSEIANYENDFEEIADQPGYYRFTNAPQLPINFENRKALFERKLDLNYRLGVMPAGHSMVSYLTQDLLDLFKDMILSMLKWEADERITPLDLLNHPFMKAMSQHLEVGRLESSSESKLQSTQNSPSDLTSVALVMNHNESATEEVSSLTSNSASASSLDSQFSIMGQIDNR